jgi:multidrug efflux system membrane fusion protein
MRRLTFSFTGVVAAAITLLPACRRHDGSSGAMAQMPSPHVTVAQPVKGEVLEWDEYPGRLEATEMVEVRARVSGYLQSVNFKDGTEVKKGDLLFVIDPRPYQAEVDRANANVNQAETKLQLAINDANRAGKLLAAKAISEEEADSRSKAQKQAEAALLSSKANLEVAKLNLEYTRITAPIGGRMGRKMITEGNLVNGNQGQSTMLATIVSLDPIYCYFDPDESAVLKYEQLAREGKSAVLSSGQVPCELELGNETGFPHKGTLDFVDNQINTGTGTLHVRALFPNSDRVLEPGFFARVRVPSTGKYEGLLVPDVAIGTDQGQKFVYVLNDKQMADVRLVKIGPLVNGLRLIREGVQPSDWIIVNGLMGVMPGVPLKAEKTNTVARPSTTQTAGVSR